MNSSEWTDKYLPEPIRSRIEQRYYAQINAQARLEQAIRDPEFLRNPAGHVALWSDHGLVHVRDVTQQIVRVLEAVHGVLIPARRPDRLELMKGYGVMAAYVHDIGMVDFSPFGRAIHPEYASQAVMGAEFDEIIDGIWEGNCGNLPWRLTALAGEGLLQNPKVVLREMLALACCHSKSKVPVAVLNDREGLRQLIQKIISTDLKVLYYEQQVGLARRALALAQHAQDQVQVERLAAALQEAQTAFEIAARSGPRHDCLSEQVQRAYGDFERDAFCWLQAGPGHIDELVQDVVDTLRALRCADALRQRGSVLKTSGQYEMFVDQRTANAVCALRQEDDRLILLQVPGYLSAGEANIASSELDRNGNLRISFHRGAFGDQETTQRAAYSAALVVDDVQGDVIESFQRPEGEAVPVDRTSADIQILLEGVDDNFMFADLVRQHLEAINPTAGARVRLVPSLRNTSASELARYLEAREVEWDEGRRRQVLDRIAESGHKTAGMDPKKAFQDVKIISLKAGEVLIEAGSPAGFVYIPLADGLQVSPLGGYQPFQVHAWMPLGVTGVIRGAARNATVRAEQELTLLMIPQEIYLKHWHRTYDVGEFARLFAQAEH